MTNSRRSLTFHGASIDPAITCTGMVRMAPKIKSPTIFPISIFQVYLT